MQGPMKLEAREWDDEYHCFNVAQDPDEQRNLGEQACAPLPDLARSRVSRHAEHHPSGPTTHGRGQEAASAPGDPADRRVIPGIATQRGSTRIPSTRAAQSAHGFPGDPRLRICCRRQIGGSTPRHELVRALR